MVFLIRWRPRKLAQRGDQQLSRAHFLLHVRGNEIDPRDRTTIEDRLTYASDLRHGLENGTFWKQIEQARIFSGWADETLRILKGMLLPGPPTQTGPPRRPINLS